jgi:hypothetical protein
MPPGDRLGKIGGMHMSGYRVPFFRRKRGPRWLLAIPAEEPSITVFAVWASVLLYQEKTVIAVN